MGPLQGLRIIELFCIGPGPFAGMLLSDMGADVLLVQRPQEPKLGYPEHQYRTLWRNRQAVTLDLSQPAGVDAFLQLVETADGVIEGNRPGVAERLGIGPDECLQRNPKLVYGRMTGWGQQGPKAHEAGFDINFIALTGLLHAIGPAEQPLPPLIAGGDFGGGGTFLALGMLGALWEAQRSGQGQVVDASIVDGAANLMAYMYGGLAGGTWTDQRASNTLDGGYWRYGTYTCADGKFVSVGTLLNPFLQVLLDKLELSWDDFPDSNNPQHWPAYREKLAAIFVTKTRDDWVEFFAGTDACVVPVLSMSEAPSHPHNLARQTFIEHGGVTQPAPAPRFSRTESEISRPPPGHGEHTQTGLLAWGVSQAQLDLWNTNGATGNQSP